MHTCVPGMGIWMHPLGCFQQDQTVFICVQDDRCMLDSLARTSC